METTGRLPCRYNIRDDNDETVTKSPMSRRGKVASLRPGCLRPPCNGPEADREPSAMQVRDRQEPRRSDPYRVHHDRIVDPSFTKYVPAMDVTMQAAQIASG